MLYVINLRRLVCAVLPLDFSSQRRTESDGHYRRRMADNEDRLNAALTKAKEYGWKNWLKTEKQSEESMCRYFTNEICPAMPITQLTVEG